jgi:1-acyl-sn-glycerol-3-phosphate acyltransferase
MNLPLKIAASVLFLIAYLFLSCLVSMLPVTGRVRRRMRVRTASLFSRLALAILRVRVRIDRGSRTRRDPGGLLVVANHVSYIDILIISSLLPAVFITSVELRDSFLLGALARLGGCLFVERRRPHGLKREIGDIARTLSQGFPVVLFPEGTTSNGDSVRQFKNPLFDAAVSAGVDVLPVCLRYTNINNGPVTHNNRDRVFYYGGATFVKHLFGLLAQKSLDVQVMPLNTLAVHGRTSRKELAAEAHAAISAAYHSVNRP